ncbi:MAG: hypothetical protein WBZ11_19820 [Candidatus Sulfotelmatobacter sp.]
MAMPLARQYLLNTVAPPVLAGLWWVFSRGWATAVQGGEVSERTRKRQKWGLIVVLVLIYVLMFGATTYLHFAR